MAALDCVLDSGSISLTGGSAKTVLQLTMPSNQCGRIKGYKVTFDGATSTNTPASVELVRQSTAGTMTSQTPQKLDSGRDETVQATGSKDSSGEPTVTSTLDTAFVPVYGGVYHFMFPSDTRPIVPGGGRIGLKITAPSAVNCRASLWFEE
ncbi:MAG: hypothetical protein HC888_00515 [Candidatus Competibacteraceae bacterium]|nr:hypothetical protein [Candidatus Competibacteraceae bacterium]